MKKYFLFVLIATIMPNLCFGVSARYTQLVREKQRKMEELEKCMGAQKGLKIAGVSTLGLTAVGVAGNIYEASAIKKYDSEIESADKAIAKTTTDNDNLKTLNECKLKLYKSGSENADKIASVEKTEEDCEILTCVKGFKPDDNHKSCIIEPVKTKEQTQEIEEKSAFQTLCEDFDGTYDVNAISTNETDRQGNIIQVNIPVYAACVLSGEKNTENNCKELVAKCESEKNYIHYKQETGLCACLGDLQAKCLNGEATCRDAHDQNNNITNKTALDLATCKTDVNRAASKKWTLGKAVENSFRDTASSYELSVEDDTQIYNNHKTTVYQEIFATKQQVIDTFVIPNESGHTWTCNYITIKSDSCGGKTYKECWNPFYECKLDFAKLSAEKEAENKYIEALTQSICYENAL